MTKTSLFAAATALLAIASSGIGIGLPIDNSARNRDYDGERASQHFYSKQMRHHSSSWC